MKWLAIALLAVGLQTPTPDPTLLDSLPGKAGWLAVGMRDAKDFDWITATSVEVVGVDGDQRTRVPKPRDVLVLTRDLQVTVVGVHAPGGGDVAIFPGGRILRKDDLAGVLPEGTRVRVLELKTARLQTHDVIDVWALVSPER